MLTSLELLEKLCNTVGVSGYENETRELIRGIVTPFVDEVYTDPLGNLVAVRHAHDIGERHQFHPTLMLDAHMDEIGMVVSHVEPEGFLRFALIGGWDERVLPAQAVTLLTRDGARLRGVIGTAPPHIQKDEERRKPYGADALFIDVGARGRDEVAAMGIRVGDCAVPDRPFEHLTADTVMGRALDDRAGCTVLIRVLQAIADEPRLPVNVAAAFTTFEEIGARGAHVAAHTIKPAMALVLEGTVAGDCPGVPASRCPSRQGAGPAITIMDRHTHCSPVIVRFLEELADREGIPWQHKTPIFGGSDAARIHISRAGVPTGIVSVPCRYIHSACSTLRLDDLERTVELATAFTRECRAMVNR